jgi:lipoate-protein ligase A
MEKKWRLILDTKNDGFYNMAADEALLLWYEKTGVPVLRIYGWNTPFLTLGYRQKPSLVLKNKELPFTLRLTGGAAILHHNEITYSFVCSPDALGLRRGVKESYQKICQFLIYFYLKLGLKVQFASDLIADGLGGYGNFCFSSFEHFDLLAGGKKIGGNAQARRKNIIFQHGSIPVDLDFAAIENSIHGASGLQEKTTCLRELGVCEDFLRLQKLLFLSFHETFRLKFQLSGFGDFEDEACRSLLASKYLTHGWKFKNEKTLLA